MSDAVHETMEGRGKDDNVRNQVNVNASGGSIVNAQAISGINNQGPLNLSFNSTPVAVAQPPVQQETRSTPVSVEEQPIQSDWKRPDRITPSSQEFKNRILTEKKNDQIDDAVKDFAALPDHEDSDSTFVVIMSHGERIKNKDAIAGVNHDPKNNTSDVFFVDDIFKHLNSKNCHDLIDKPKVILIQACRGERPEGDEIQSDAIPHTEKDFIPFKSCLPGTSAYRNPVYGSFFIMYIVEVFCKWAQTEHVAELFRKVALRMENDPRFTGVEKLMPCIDRMSFPKHFYLFPGL